MNLPQAPNSQDEATRRALDRIAGEEMVLMRQEKDEREANEQQARAQMFEASDAAEIKAIEAMRALGTKYGERSLLAFKALQAIAEFAKCESEISTTLSAIDAELAQYWQHTVRRNLAGARWASLRIDAGLEESHRTLGIDAPQTASERIAAVCLLGIMRGNIASGAIICGAKHLPFDFGDATKI